MTHAVVVGAYGSAGVAAAEGLADAPEIDRLTLVDDGEPGGGLCILRGCMPSKEVLSAAGHRYRARRDPRVGDPGEMDVERTVALKNEHTSSFAAHRRDAVDELAEREAVEFVHDTARFVGERALRVGGRELEADYVVVATGSTVSVPDLDGLEGVEAWTSADVLDATDLPDSGVVMGFGYVGLELVPYLAEAGVELTVVEHDERPLTRAPAAMGETLLELYREEFGVEILTGARERSVESTGEGVRMSVQCPEGIRDIEADALFMFTGRHPNLRGVALDTCGVDTEGEWVKDTLETRDDGRVYVVGDANGKRMLLHNAKEEGYLAAENVAAAERGAEPEAYDPIAHEVVFSAAAEFPYARLGKTIDEAEEAGYDAFEVRRAAADDGVFKTKDAAVGEARLVVADDGEILGYQGLHQDADVLAKTLQVVIENEMGVSEVPDRAYHPTTPEILDGLLGAAADRL
jgi:dihydrolipoamide dehydrogenase